MSELKLRRRTPTEVVYGHAPAGGWFAVLFGGLLVALGLRSDDAATRAAFALGIVFVLLGVFALVWRNEIELDLRGRRLRRTRGVWPRARVHTDGFDVINQLVLERDDEYRRGKKIAVSDRRSRRQAAGALGSTHELPQFCLRR